MQITTLFVDLNAYFASVEQQVDRSLRGRPVAVAPITSDSGCCIAASYEAKAFGVSTGSRVGDARRLCPQLVVADARPRLYVLMHHRVLAAVDTVMPIHQVHSIDELSCRFDRTQRTPERARELALRIKAAIRERCGAQMRCSIGIAPNRVLAKLGTDLQKPDGLVVLSDDNLPGAIAGLAASELAGIGPRMSKRLEAAGVRTIGDLLDRSEKQLEQLWGGVVGRRWWYWLRGHEVSEPRTRKRSLGHSHVLAPELRTLEGARSVAYRLLLKAAARMRHDRYAAGTLTLSVNFQGAERSSAGWGAAGWSGAAALGEGCVDSTTMLETLDALWSGLPMGQPMQVAVTLSDLVSMDNRTLPLFQDESRRADLSRAMDAVNNRFGAQTLYTANMQHARSAGTGGIAFHFVPDLTVTDSVSDRMRGAGKPLSDTELEALIERSVAEDAGNH